MRINSPAAQSRIENFFHIGRWSPSSRDERIREEEVIKAGCYAPAARNPVYDPSMRHPFSLRAKNIAPSSKVTSKAKDDQIKFLNPNCEMAVLTVMVQISIEGVAVKCQHWQCFEVINETNTQTHSKNPISDDEHKQGANMHQRTAD
jgi:hypothetical protein